METHVANRRRLRKNETLPNSHVSTELSVVIPSLGRVDKLPPLINALKRQNLRPIEIIVVLQDVNEFEIMRDAYSGPEESASTRIVISKSRERSSAIARNVGAAAATATWLAFIDDDCMPVTDSWLRELVQPLLEGEAIASSGAIHGWQSVRSLHLPGRANYVIPLLLHPVGDPSMSTPAQLDTVWGLNFCISRNTYLALGGMSRRFVGPSLYEETEFSLRLRRRYGRRAICFAPAAVVEHRQEATGGQRGAGGGYDPTFLGKQKGRLIGERYASAPIRRRLSALVNSAVFRLYHSREATAEYWASLRLQVIS